MEVEVGSELEPEGCRTRHPRRHSPPSTINAFLAVRRSATSCKTTAWTEVKVGPTSHQALRAVVCQCPDKATITNALSTSTVSITTRIKGRASCLKTDPIWTTQCCLQVELRPREAVQITAATNDVHQAWTASRFPSFPVRRTRISTTVAIQLEGRTPTSQLLISRIVLWFPNWCPERRATNAWWSLKNPIMVTGLITMTTRRRVKKFYWQRKGLIQTSVDCKETAPSRSSSSIWTQRLRTNEKVTTRCFEAVAP